MMKRYILYRLQRYVQRYFRQHPSVKLIAIVGSVGKTSTKHALISLLDHRYRVRAHRGNHNSDVSVPLAILGIEYPSNIRSIKQWFRVFAEAKKVCASPQDVDVIIQELGTDHPGDIADFGRYLRPDISIVTAVTPEHMEFFSSLDAVAKEELSVAQFSKLCLINSDDVEEIYIDEVASLNPMTFGVTATADVSLSVKTFDVQNGYSVVIDQHDATNAPIEATIRVVGQHSLKPVLGAVAAGIQLGLRPDDIEQQLATIRPISGRMNLIKGGQNATIIDDSYNASPAATAAALATLYAIPATQRIAIVGDMRELGASSAQEHRAIGELCQADKLSLLITVGPEARDNLAPIAVQNGCRVYSTLDARDAGHYAATHISKNEEAVILVKGSQNTIFLEEAIKQLVDESHYPQLVRQSPEWLNKKAAFFAGLNKNQPTK